MDGRKEEKQQGSAELLGSFTPSGQPENMLCSFQRNRAQSTDAEKGVLPFALPPPKEAEKPTSDADLKPHGQSVSSGSSSKEDQQPYV